MGFLDIYLIKPHSGYLRSLMYNKDNAHFYQKVAMPSFYNSLGSSRCCKSYMTISLLNLCSHG